MQDLYRIAKTNWKLTVVSLRHGRKSFAQSLFLFCPLVQCHCGLISLFAIISKLLKFYHVSGSLWLPQSAFCYPYFSHIFTPPTQIFWYGTLLPCFGCLLTMSLSLLVICLKFYAWNQALLAWFFFSPTQCWMFEWSILGFNKVVSDEFLKELFRHIADHWHFGHQRST